MADATALVRLRASGPLAADSLGYRTARIALDLLLPIAAITGGVFVMLSRSPRALRHPVLYAEDGRVWFGDAYNQGWFRPLTEPHTGYLQTFPRLIAGIGLSVSLLNLPGLFVDVAVAVQVLPAAFIVSRRLEGLVPHRPIRIVLAALYLALPNSREINANLTNAQWHLALLALLVTVAAPGRLPWQIFDVLVVFLSDLTGPFAIALTVVALVVMLARRTRWSVVLLVETVVLACIQIGELLSSSRGIYAGLGASWARFLEIAGNEIVGGAFLGEKIQLASVTGPHDIGQSQALFIGGAVLVVAVMVFGPLELKLVNLYAGLLLAASLLDPVVSVRKIQWQALALDPQMRYWFFPTVALLADGVWLATRVRGFGTGTRRLSARFVVRLGASALGVTMLVVASLYAIPQDWHYRPLPKVAWVAQVRAFDAAPAHKLFIFHISPRNWVMKLVKH